MNSEIDAPNTSAFERLISMIQDHNSKDFASCFKKEISNKDITDEAGNTLLIYAAKYDAKEIATFLISEGCDVNIANKNLNTALHFAFSNKSFEVVNILIKEKADERQRNIDGLMPCECFGRSCE